ncbi:uncharacterized protein LOC130737006 [Lotus japonicus]|uniref:uncharacterized protein LOC130737006 n=1 Tax=Lotus japonicus TaxID=34305 RepID=UPI002583B27E|nr:uncharacterized protein LOC130737006 [Lotus japonicus]
MAQNPSCPVCNRGRETVVHALLECGWTRPVWFGSQLHLSASLCGVQRMDEWMTTRVYQFRMGNDSADHSLSYLAFLLWGIWKARNNKVFNSHALNPTEVIVLVQSLQGEYFKEHIAARRHPDQSLRVREQPSWKKPGAGLVKCNTDASFKAPDVRSAGSLVLRDDSGHLLSAHARLFFTRSPVVAEAIALRDAAVHTSNLGCTHVLFEADALEVIQACNGVKPCGEISNIIQDIQLLSQGFAHCRFIWTPREGNEVAHIIGDLARKKQLAPNWAWVLPRRVVEALRRDEARAG